MDRKDKWLDTVKIKWPISYEELEKPKVGINTRANKYHAIF